MFNILRGRIGVISCETFFVLTDRDGVSGYKLKKFLCDRWGLQPEMVAVKPLLTPDDSHHSIALNDSEVAAVAVETDADIILYVFRPTLKDGMVQIVKPQSGESGYCVPILDWSNMDVKHKELVSYETTL